MNSYLSNFNFQFFAEGSQVSWHPGTTFPQRKWVFLHGLMGYGLNFRRIASSLGPGQIALCYDQRGHGKSFKPNEGYSPKIFAEDLKKILDELQWKQIILVGHSMGGRNALAFSYMYPQYLSKLIIVDIGPESKPEAVLYFKQLFDAVPTPFQDKKAAKEFLMNEFKRTPFAQTLKSPDTLGMYLYSNLVEDESGRADWRFSKTAMMQIVVEGRTKPQWDEVKAIGVPSLLVRGQLSEDLPQSIYEKTLETNSNIKGAIVNNAGHWVHSEQPEEFIRIIKEFANSH